MCTYKTAKETVRGQGKHQGQNWIRPEKRLAIYLRDGIACAYCGAGVEDGIILTLDHVIPHSRGGDNKETNLVTACLTCNSSRGNRSLTVFAKAVAEYRQLDYKCIVNNIKRLTKKTLNIEVAKELIAERGSCAKAIKTI